MQQTIYIAIDVLVSFNVYFIYILLTNLIHCILILVIKSRL